MHIINQKKNTKSKDDLNLGNKIKSETSKILNFIPKILIHF